MTFPTENIFPLAIAIIGGFLGILTTIIGWFVRNAFREFTERVDQAVHDSATRFDAMNVEVKGLRVDIAEMMSAQAVGHERFTIITEKILELKASDERLWERVTEAIERLTRLEGQKTPTPVKRRIKA